MMKFDTDLFPNAALNVADKLKNVNYALSNLIEELSQKKSRLQAMKSQIEELNSKLNQMNLNLEQDTIKYQNLKVSESSNGSYDTKIENCMVLKRDIEENILQVQKILYYIESQEKVIFAIDGKLNTIFQELEQEEQVGMNHLMKISEIIQNYIHIEMKWTV